MRETDIDVISRTHGGVVRKMRLWAADTDDEHARGLRGIDSLPFGIDGMIFDFQNSSWRSMSMWNCHFPLAFLFINESFQIRQIILPVEPDDQRPPIITSEMPVRYVIELTAEAFAATRQADINDLIDIKEN